MKVWITRDKKTKEDHLVFIWDGKPHCIPGIEEVEWVSGSIRAFNGISISNFKKEFGFIPRKGSCIEKELELK